MSRAPRDIYWYLILNKEKERRIRKYILQGQSNTKKRTVHYLFFYIKVEVYFKILVAILC